jgi:hypothetical protein
VTCRCCPESADPFELFWYPGDTTSIRVTLIKADGTPYPLAGCGLRFVVAAGEEPGAEVLWDLTPADGTLILDAAGGIGLLSPGPTRSAALAYRRTYPALLSITTADGELLRLAPGYLLTYPAVPTPAA